MDGSALETGEPEDGGDLVNRFLALESEMAAKLRAIPYDERVRVVYNPLEYAAQTHEYFVRASLGSGRPKAVFLGMNPGPNGMSQNGVPFGDTVPVRDWLCIRGEVRKPYPEHPKRPVDGLQCSKTEVSGKRFWGLMKELCGGDARRFLEACFVHNFCPLSFMMDNGRNITPDQLRGEGKKRLHEICDDSLREVLALLRPELVVGIGKYATERATAAVSRLESAGGMRVEGIAHPSPASPEANQGWHKLAMHQLNGAGLLQLVGWSISEDLLREAAEEAQRITAAKITRSAKISRSPTKRRSTDTPSGTGAGGIAAAIPPPPPPSSAPPIVTAAATGTPSQPQRPPAPTAAPTPPVSKPARKKRPPKGTTDSGNTVGTAVSAAVSATTTPTNTNTPPATTPNANNTNAVAAAATTPVPVTVQPAVPAGPSGSPANNGATWTPSPQGPGVPAAPEAHKPNHPTYDNFNSGFTTTGLAPPLGPALWPQPQWPGASAAPLPWGAAPIPYYNGYAYSAYDPSKHWPTTPNAAATQFRAPTDNASSWNWGQLTFPGAAGGAPAAHKDVNSTSSTLGGSVVSAASPYNVQSPAVVTGAGGGGGGGGGIPGGVMGGPTTGYGGGMQQHGGTHPGQPQQLGQQVMSGHLSTQPNPAHSAHLQLPAQVFSPTAAAAPTSVGHSQTMIGGNGGPGGGIPTGGGMSMFSSPMDLASSANSLASMQAVQAVQAAQVAGAGGPYDAANVRSLVNSHLYSLQES